MSYEAFKIPYGILVPLVDEKSRYPFQNFRQDIVLRTRPGGGAHVLRSPSKFLDGILVPLVDEKLSLPLSELSPRHRVTNTAWRLGAFIFSRSGRAAVFCQPLLGRPSNCTLMNILSFSTFCKTTRVRRTETSFL